MEEDLKLLLRKLKVRLEGKGEREEREKMFELWKGVADEMREDRKLLASALGRIEKGIDVLSKKEIGFPEIQKTEIKKPEWYKEPPEKVEIKNLKIPEFPEEIKVKDLKIPEFPKEIDVKRPAWIEKIAALFKTEIRMDILKDAISDLAKKILKVRIEEQARPLQVIPIDKDGRVILPASPIVQCNSPKEVGIKDSGGTRINPAKEDGHLANLPGLSIPVHDYIELGYTGSNLTSVVYKTGGSGGTTVATLTLGYTDDNLTSVTKS